MQMVTFDETGSGTCNLNSKRIDVDVEGIIYTYALCPERLIMMIHLHSQTVRAVPNTFSHGSLSGLYEKAAI